MTCDVRRESTSVNGGAGVQLERAQRADDDDDCREEEEDEEEEGGLSGRKVGEEVTWQGAGGVKQSNQRDGGYEHSCDSSAARGGGGGRSKSGMLHCACARGDGNVREKGGGRGDAVRSEGLVWELGGSGRKGDN